MNTGLEYGFFELKNWKETIQNREGKTKKGGYIKYDCKSNTLTRYTCAKESTESGFADLKKYLDDHGLEDKVKRVIWINEHSESGKVFKLVIDCPEIYKKICEITKDKDARLVFGVDHVSGKIREKFKTDLKWERISE